jgi:hypothetical protein
MNETDRTFLKTQLDQVVALEMLQGDQLLVQLLFIFDEEPTPDLFCLEVTANPDGTYTPKNTTGLSILFSDIRTASAAA